MTAVVTLEPEVIVQDGNASAIIGLANASPFQSALRLDNVLSAALQQVRDEVGTYAPFWLATDEVRARVDAASGANTPMVLANLDEPASGETDQTVGLAFMLNGTTDDGGTYAEHLAARVEA